MLADELKHAISTMAMEDLRKFLVDWRVRLRVELTLVPSNVLHRKQLQVARNVMPGFPSCEVVHLFCHPVTSSDAMTPLDMSQWGRLKPDLPSLADWCERYFSWGTSGQILKRFQNNVWAGICLWHLLKVCSHSSAHHLSFTHEERTILPQPTEAAITLAAYFADEPGLDFTCKSILCIKKECLGPGRPLQYPVVPGYRIKIGTHTLASATNHGLPTNVIHPDPVEFGSSTSIWVPRVILQRACPGLVESFGQDLPTHHIAPVFALYP
jgi:Holliday junction resolvase YEN1